MKLFCRLEDGMAVNRNAIKKVFFDHEQVGSRDGKHLYWYRKLLPTDMFVKEDQKKPIVFVSLHPNLGDNSRIHNRCCDLALAMGGTECFVLNLFSYRVISAESLVDAEERGERISGYYNNLATSLALEYAGSNKGQVVCSWGFVPKSLKDLFERRIHIFGLLHKSSSQTPLGVLGLNSANFPTHPLFLSASKPPFLSVVGGDGFIRNKALYRSNMPPRKVI